MHMKVKKYKGQPTVLVMSSTDAKALQLKHDQIVDVPAIKIVR